MQGLSTDRVVRVKDALHRINACKAAKYRREARRIEREEAEEAAQQTPQEATRASKSINEDSIATPTVVDSLYFIDTTPSRV